MSISIKRLSHLAAESCHNAVARILSCTPHTCKRLSNMSESSATCRHHNSMQTPADISGKTVHICAGRDGRGQTWGCMSGCRGWWALSNRPRARRGRLGRTTLLRPLGTASRPSWAPMSSKLFRSYPICIPSPPWSPPLLLVADTVNAVIVSEAVQLAAAAAGLKLVVEHCKQYIGLVLN